MWLSHTEFVRLRGLPPPDFATAIGRTRSLALTDALVAFVQRHILLTREYPA